jgi:hypothetical protein
VPADILPFAHRAVLRFLLSSFLDCFIEGDKVKKIVFSSEFLVERCPFADFKSFSTQISMELMSEKVNVKITVMHYYKSIFDPIPIFYSKN